MKRIYLASICAAALVALISPAHAADMPARVAKAPAPIAAPLFNWSGFYLGSYVGWQKSEYADVEDLPWVDLKGWTTGYITGWNYQTGNWVWGIEGDYGLSYADGPGNGNFTSAKIKSVANARVRAGWAFDRVLWFVAGGASWTHFGIEHNPYKTNTHRGWTLGAGVDWAYSDSLVLRLEYLYASFSEKDWNFDGDHHTIGYDKQHTIRVAALWRFATGKYPIGKTPAPAPIVAKN
jgi:outer membrane immunogenic protein